MLTEKFLEEWVPIVVPEEFGPNKNPEAGKPLLGIYLTPDDKMETIRDFWFKNGEGNKLFGQLVDIGEVLSLAGKSENKLKNRFIIRVNSSQTVESGIFTLAHELGHMVGILNKDKTHDEDPDEYADAYAFELVRRVIKDETLRTSVCFEAFLHKRF